jgi:hypothetical protein
MTLSDEMMQAACAASPGDTLGRSLRPAVNDGGPRRPPLPLRIGQSAPAYLGGVDRLAQLTRLIERDETLAAIVRGGHLEQRVELSLPSEKPTSSPPAQEDKAFEQYCEGETGAALVHPGSCHGPTAELHDLADYGEYNGPDYSNGLPDQRRGLRMFAALIGLALAGSATAFASWALSDKRGRGDAARVIVAPISPEKTAPSPREHSHLDERLYAHSDERSVNAPGRTMTGAEEPADAKPPMPPAPPPTAVAFGPAQTKMAELTPGPTPPGRPAATALKQPADVMKPAPRQTALGAAEPSGAHGMPYVVQLSSERGEAAAHAKSQALQNKYRNAFAGREPFIRRADLGDRGVYYRVQIGPFAIGEANQICENFKKSGADCIVHRN